MRSIWNMILRLIAADNIMTFKLVLPKQSQRDTGFMLHLCQSRRMVANGSGMHLNMSLKEMETMFFSDKDPKGLSKEAYYFIGGIMKHMKAISFITNPT